jgi:spoIIIJ-associated protein
MIDQNDIQKIEETAKEFLNKMTLKIIEVRAQIASENEKKQQVSEDVLNFSISSPKNETEPDAGIKNEASKNAVDLDIKIEDPQILIGEKGQTLFETQRILRTILNKKIQKQFYLNLDIDGYKRKKIDYLRVLAQDLADKAASFKEEKNFSPMPAYERRIIHSALSKREDVITESRGDGEDRYVVVKPR